MRIEQMQTENLAEVCSVDSNATDASLVSKHVIARPSVFDESKSFVCDACSNVCDKTAESDVPNKKSDGRCWRCTDCVRELACRSCWKAYADTPVGHCFTCALPICESCTYHCTFNNCAHLSYCVTCWRNEVKTCSLCATVRCDFFDSFDCDVCGAYVCGKCVPQSFEEYWSKENVCVHCLPSNDNDEADAEHNGPIKTIA